MARPIAKDHDEKRRAILKTAARVFSEEGIARASMSMVADACGISKANIYHYYPSKDGLLFAILDTHLRTLRDVVCALPEKGSAEDRLLSVTTEILLAYEGMDHEHRIQIEGLSRLSPDQQRQLRTYQRDMVARVDSIIGDLAVDGFAGQPEKRRAATMSVFGMLNWYFMWAKDATDVERRAYAAHVTALAIGGVRAL